MRSPCFSTAVWRWRSRWQATTRWIEVGQLGALLALVEAGLFVFSDAALAWNRFRRPFDGA
ncbi:MAG: lysoplasmalogenase family protein, partial [Thermoanaerobaculia bacterium]